MGNFEILSQSVISGDEAKVKEAVTRLRDSGVSPLDIISKGLIGGMNIVGARFKNGEMFIPEVLMAAKSMKAGIEVVKPLIGDANMPNEGTIILGTVKGDLHDIGKNLVRIMLESGGFKVVDVGIDTAPEKFVAAVKEHKADILAMSALLTTTMTQMKDTIDLIKEAGLRGKVKTIIGGAPISQEFANQIGADGFGSDAASAVELCRKFLSRA